MDYSSVLHCLGNISICSIVTIPINKTTNNGAQLILIGQHRATLLTVVVGVVAEILLWTKRINSDYPVFKKRLRMI